MTSPAALLVAGCHLFFVFHFRRSVLFFSWFPFFSGFFFPFLFFLFFLTADGWSGVLALVACIILVFARLLLLAQQ